MAVTRAAAASKSNFFLSKTDKNKSSKRQTKKTPTFTNKGQQKEYSGSTCCSLKIKRTKSPGVRLINGRIYDSENGKTCHQCRQKTMDFSASCKNFIEKKQCTFHYCHICLLNRYGEKAEEAVALGCQWKCPSCRGVCNCSRCMKKRGCRPTGVLLQAAKANGFSSVSEMLQWENINKPEKDEGASSKKRKAPNESILQEPAAGIKGAREETGLVKTKSSTCRPPRDLKMKGNKEETSARKILNTRKAGGKDNFVKEKRKDNNTTVKKRNSKRSAMLIDSHKRREKVTECANGRQLIKINPVQAPEKWSRGLSNEEEESEEPTNVEVESDEDEPVEEVQLNGETAVEIHTEVSDVEIPLPQGCTLTKVANIDLSAEDVGYALQFLEFCEAFGQVLNLKKGQPQLLLQELTSTKDSHRRRNFSERLHIKLLSMIQEDSEKGCSSLKARGRNSWLEALKKYIAEYPYFSKDLILNSADLDPDGYKKLNSSKKLRIMTSLCDVALGTVELRNWIDEENLELVKERKKAKEIFLHQEKNERKKLQDEVARTILLRNGAPLSIAEHENLVSVIKVEVAQSLAAKLEAAHPEMKMKRSDAVRSDPILLDANGRKFWKLRSYTAEMDILLQDVAYGDMVSAEEKWFFYDPHEKANVERYISSFKEAQHSAEVIHHSK